MNRQTDSFSLGEATILASDLLQSEENFEFLPPPCHDSKLIFQVFCNGMPVGYARLEKENYSSDDRIVALFSATNFPSYNLKMIQIIQNYRGRGIGSLLMQEIVHYCRHHHIHCLKGEIQGEIGKLESWYKRLGFDVLANRKIELRISRLGL